MGIQYCFILGLEQRTGTNYLAKLLTLHKDIAFLVKDFEDFFSHYSAALDRYIDDLNKDWLCNENLRHLCDNKDRLYSHIGRSLINFLDDANSNKPEQLGTKVYRLSKTPSVHRSEHYFKLFPNARYILLVRDGRSIIESGMRSFNWKFENAVRGFKNSVKNIAHTKAVAEEKGIPLHILKYEDLVQNTEAELSKIFNFLALDTQCYDFKAAESFDVVGSSQFKNQDNQVHWQPVKKDAQFNPLERYAHWSEFRHQRYFWLAAKEHNALGYTIKTPKFGPLARLKHHMVDSLWLVYRSFFILAKMREYIRQSYQAGVLSASKSTQLDAPRSTR